MPMFLIVSLIVGWFSIIFAMQNINEVSIKFFFWSFKSPLALVLLLTLLAGVIIGIFISLPTIFKQRKKTLQQKREVKEHKKLLKELEERTNKITQDTHEKQEETKEDQ